ncbi:MAG TPA: B12-binding domain-containing radical SAM protein [Candidatus Brocadiia bacterium]|nr:radical SAM protein [Candidatus Brocadiales bacterium]
MNILLLNPPAPTAVIREGRCQSPQNMRKTSIPQMSLAYIASVLEKNNYQIELYDCIALEIDEEKLISIIKSEEPRLAIVNVTTPSFYNDIKIIEKMKSVIPDCIIAIFGTHATSLHKSILSAYPCVDVVIRGEPERTAEELAYKIKNGDGFSDVLGISFRANGSVHENKERPWVDDLDELGYPARHLLPNNKYIHPVTNKPYTTVNTSRGCRQQCIFCVAHLYYGYKLRKRSVKSVLDEIQFDVIGKYGINNIWMFADDFTGDKNFVVDICKGIIQRNLKITWWSNTRVDVLDREMFEWMKKSGCFMLSIGGESGNQDILNRMKKRAQLSQIKNTIKMLREVGILSLVYFLIGLPGESRSTIKDTVDFAKQINPDYVEFYPATPYPGTEFYEIAKKENMITTDDWSLYECGGIRFVVRVPGVSHEELECILQDAYKEFYYRTPYLLLLLKRMTNPVEFLRLCRFGLTYFKRLLPGKIRD